METLINKLAQIRDVKKRRNYLVTKGFHKSEIDKILEEVHLHIKGKKKFPRANQMKFTKESLAQASSKYLAEYRTWKMQQQLGAVQKALDVGSGVGGDTIAMALRWRVISVEKDSAITEMLKHNISVYNVEKNVTVIFGDILELLDYKDFQKQLNDVDCIFFDPSRRRKGKRTVKIEEYEPPISLVERLQNFSENVCVKISPGVDLSRIHYDCDIEVVSYKGEVREVMLWFGKFKIASDKRSLLATKLPEKITRIQKSKSYNIPVSRPKKYVYEPDPAFIKAHLISDIAEEYNLNQLHKEIAYLTSDQLISTPILKCYQVLTYIPQNYGIVNKKIDELNLGKLDFKARGVSIDLKNIHKFIRGKGKKKGLIIFTMISNKPSVIICKYALNYSNIPK
ncbi:MAG: hypothetical protein ACXAEX_19055 [Promethearchaeota archaeon]|jgi:hypothetical protein